MAITKYEQFDFLIDIVPREESKPHKKHVNLIKDGKLKFIKFMFQDNNMGEVQYIVTLPQASQGSTIQLPSNKSFIYYLNLIFE